MANILIVDDSRTSRKILRGILESAGFTIVAEATNGVEGYDKYVEFRPDIVTMDITMPVLDGLGGLKKIKETYPESKVVMVTAAGQKNKMVEAIQAGADDFIPKPFDSEELVATLKRVIDE
ncbi:MAG: response regulator [Lachnospiraceae bacterium]|nr:response regulator [Lachnospiraceae bacterium]